MSLKAEKQEDEEDTSMQLENAKAEDEEKADNVLPRDHGAAMPTEATFYEIAYAALSAELKRHGGPAQYLRTHKICEDSNFLTHLQTFDRSDLDYHGPTLPDMDTETKFILRLCDLGIMPECSPKPDPQLCTALELLDEYLRHTFITSTDVLQLFQGPVSNDNDPKFCAHYLKGMARATTILFVAHSLWVRNWDVSILHPSLFRSMQHVHCRLGIIGGDATAIALENGKLSARGSIRKEHNVICWLGVLRTLTKKGISPTNIIGEWNARCVKKAEIIGQKRSALLQLLAYPACVQDLILKHNSILGDSSAFREDAFKNNRLQLGYAPRGMPAAWSKRLTVTEPGLCLMLNYITEAQIRKALGSKTQLDKEGLEEAMKMSQALISLASELQEQAPVKEDDLDRDVFTPFLKGDFNLELALQSALSDLNPNFAPADLPAMKGLLASSLAARDGTMASIGVASTIQPGDLEKQAWEVQFAAMKHDVQIFLAWKTRCLDRDNAIFFQKLQHLANRQTKAREIAQSVLNVASPQWSIPIVRLDPDKHGAESEANHAIHGLQKKIAALQQLRNVSDILNVFFLKWANPGTFSANALRLQASIAGAYVNQPGTTNLGMVVMPCWHYQPGHLHKSEAQAVKLLTSKGLNIDLSCVVAFKGKTDEREKRSLVYPSRLLVPMDADHSKLCYQVWRSVPMMQLPLVSELPLLKTKDMVTIEDIRNDALPETTSQDTKQPQGEKHQQLGLEAGRKIVEALCTNLQEQQRGAFAFIDATAHTLEFAKACYLENAEKKLSLPLYYIGFAEGAEKYEWSCYHMKAWLADGFLSGAVKLPPGAVLPGEELPEGTAAAVPPRPELTTLVWCQKCKADGLPTLRVPDKTMVTWSDHAMYGSDFKSWLSNLSEQGVPINLKETQAQSNAGTGGASGSGNNATPPPPGTDTGPPNKRRRKGVNSNQVTCVDVPTIPMSELPSALAWQADLPKPSAAAGGCQVVIAVG